MADEPTKEQKFSCGCHVVDGKLVAECTQVAPSGEISAERHGILKPFAAKCARKAAEHNAELARQKVADDLAAAEHERRMRDDPEYRERVKSLHLEEANRSE